MNQPKRHHFVPRAFVARFGRDELISARFRGKPKLLTTNAKNIAVEVGFYTTTDAATGKSVELEQDLAAIDSKSDGVIGSILDTNNLPRRNSDERQIMAITMAVQFARTPEVRERVLFAQNFVKYAGDRSHDETVMEEYLQNVHLGFKPRNREAEAALLLVQEWIRQGHTTMLSGDAILQPLETVSLLVELLISKQWRLEIARRPRFLTSDAPLVLWRKPSPMDDFQGVGLQNAEEIRFPISAGHQLVLSDSPERTLEVEPHRVRACNQDMAEGCFKFVLGHPDRPQPMTEVKLSPKRPPSRFMIAPGTRVLPDGSHEAMGDIIQFWTPRRALRF